MRDTMRASSLQALPEHIHRRVLNGLAVFGDGIWYRENMGIAQGSDPFTVRIGDLLRAGMLWQDCEWLIFAGLVRPLCQRPDIWRQEGAVTDAGLTEQTRVELTAAGEAALHNATLHPFERALSGNDGVDGTARPPLFYCVERQELFHGGLSVLRLTANAENMETILLAFQKRRWKKCIACPFADLTNGKRSRTVRDAVFGLNHGQRPIRVVFHSREKGARIWYAVAHEPPHGDSADRPPPRLPR